jgi:hypothetical protein
MIASKKKLLLRVGCTVFFLLIGIISLWINHATRLVVKQSIPHASEVLTSPHAAAAIKAPDGAIDREFADLVDLSSKDSTSSLISKGFPLRSRARDYAITHTQSQPIPDLVADLGNQSFISTTLADYDDIGTINDIKTWSVVLTRSTKVLRLIEEGRQHPDAVMPLLRESIRQTLALYGSASKARREEANLIFQNKASLPGIWEGDPYYAKNFRYQDSIFEFERIHYQIYSCFYVISNIGNFQQEDRQLLQAWLGLPRGWGTDCVDLNYWLVDAAMGGSDRVAAPSRSTSVSEGKIQRARWNASWELDNPLLAAKRVNTRDIPRIEIRDVEATPELTDDVKKARIAAYETNYR